MHTPRVSVYRVCTHLYKVKGVDMKGPSLRLENVTVVLGGQKVLEDVTLRVKGPGLIQVLGPNGAGKTTLFRTILGLVKPVKGRVIVNDVDVTGEPDEAGKHVSYMPQTYPEIDLPLTPIEALQHYLALYHKRWPRLVSGNLREKVYWALEAVGLPRDAWNKPLHSLSGGQRQRVMLARALVTDRPVMLLDEPLASVDPAGRAELAKLIAEFAREKLVIVSSHDPTLLLEHTDAVVLLNHRVVAFGPPEKVLRVDVLREVYGGAVVEVTEGHVHIADSHLP